MNLLDLRLLVSNEAINIWCYNAQYEPMLYIKNSGYFNNANALLKTRDVLFINNHVESMITEVIKSATGQITLRILHHYNTPLGVLQYAPNTPAKVSDDLPPHMGFYVGGLHIPSVCDMQIKD